ncbi:MAG: hypothetical protein WCI05_17175 [Myxococcales bacterium]
MNPQVALKEAEAALASGDATSARQKAERAASEGNDTIRLRAIRVLVEAGWFDEARLIALQMTGEAELQAALHLLGDSEDPREETDAFEVDVAVLRPPSAGDDEAVRMFQRFFGGRRDVHARAWYDEARQRSGYRPAEQPLTESLVRSHLQGSLTLGQYLLHPDGTCSFGVIDLDISANSMQSLRSTRGENVAPTEHARARQFALRLVDAGRRLGLPLFAEDSGGRGLHIWLFLEPRRPAAAVRSALSQILVAAGPMPPDVKAEIFPKQDRIGPRGLSSLVKLPLGVHPVTLRRCALLDEQLRPREPLLEALRMLQVAPMDAVDAVVGRRVVPLPAPELEPSAVVPRLSQQTTPRSLAEALRAIPAGPETQAACERMLQGCSVLQGIVQRAYDKQTLDPEEARSVIYSLGLVGPGPNLADETLVNQPHLENRRSDPRSEPRHPRPRVTHPGLF